MFIFWFNSDHNMYISISMIFDRKLYIKSIVISVKLKVILFYHYTCCIKYKNKSIRQIGRCTVYIFIDMRIYKLA